MFDMIAPNSVVSARDILKEIIRSDDRFNADPTIDGSVFLSEALEAERGLFVRASYLLDVWTEMKGRGEEE